MTDGGLHLYREPPTPDPGSMLRGFLVATFYNVLCLGAAALLIYVGIGILIVAGFGVAQFGWLIPLRNRYNRDGRTEDAKGVMIAAGITVLLSAACWGNIIWPR